MIEMDFIELKRSLYGKMEGRCPVGTPMSLPVLVISHGSRFDCIVVFKKSGDARIPTSLMISDVMSEETTFVEIENGPEIAVKDVPDENLDRYEGMYIAARYGGEKEFEEYSEIRDAILDESLISMISRTISERGGELDG